MVIFRSNRKRRREREKHILLVWSKFTYAFPSITRKREERLFFAYNVSNHLLLNCEDFFLFQFHRVEGSLISNVLRHDVRI